MATEVQEAVLTQNVETTDQQREVYTACMERLISEIPQYKNKYAILRDPNDSTASFYFKSSETDEINRTLYDNLISKRIKGAGEGKFNIKYAEKTSSVFTNDYLMLYDKLIFQLSPEDESIYQSQVAKVAGKMKALAPLWNNWVKANPDQKVPPLDINDTNLALMQMTSTLMGPWFNTDYTEKVRGNPSYVYQHIEEFNKIFNKIPLSVPETMLNQIKDVLITQGTQGSIVSQRSTALKIIDSIKANIGTPTSENGGLKLKGSSKMIPGMSFQPASPLTLKNQLVQDPPTTMSIQVSITKTDQEALNVDVQGGASISIPISMFLSFGASGGAQYHLFENNFVGSKFDLKLTLRNVQYAPDLAIEPTPYNISTGQGWMYTQPIIEALKTGTRTDVTGYKFTGGKPDFNFDKGGDFGIITGMILSQFPELSLTFEQCESKQVHEFFEQHASAGISFLGIPLGGGRESSRYTHDYSYESDTKITVNMKPAAPGIIPGDSDINESLCQLLAVGVTYPVAD